MTPQGPTSFQQMGISPRRSPRTSAQIRTITNEYTTPCGPTSFQQKGISPYATPRGPRSFQQMGISPRRSPRTAAQSPTIMKNLSETPPRKRMGSTEIRKPAKRRLITQPEITDIPLFEKVVNSFTKSKNCYNFRILSDKSDDYYLEITKRSVDIEPENGGPSTVARIVIGSDGNSYFQVHAACKMNKVNVLLPDGELDKSALSSLLEYLYSKWKMCGGIPKHDYEEKTKNVRYTPKGYRVKEEPCPTVFSVNCNHWFKVQRKSWKQNSRSEYICQNCNEFMNYSVRQDKRNIVTPEQKKQRQTPTSRYPIHLLSPSSRKIRQDKCTARIRADSKSMARLRKRLEKTRLSLNEEQNKEMLDITTIINEKYNQELSNILLEAKKTSPETCDILEESWRQDCLDRKKFFNDQAKNMTGDKQNAWSTVTYRMALAIMSRSKSAYEALKSFKILQLPSVASLKKFQNFRLHKSGINSDTEDYIREQSEHYQSYKKELQNKGRKVPLGEGILIFDEVRVTSKVKWSANGEKFFGLELTDDECPHLHDIYASFDPKKPPQPASYNLQFLWRDMTSDFDVIGPYFSTSLSLEHKYIISCVLQTMRLFHQFDFKIVSLVCDGASSNLAAIKILTQGKKGCYGSQPGNDPHKIKPWFVNPFDPTLNVYCIICPSHQLKNQINALYQSRPGGTKAFKTELQKPEFGWKTICDMWGREEAKRKEGQLFMVKGLKQSYIVRDPWTKLAVLPAKIMQQTAVLKELKAYLATNPPDSDEVLQTCNYLEACHNIFEIGFLEKN